MTNEFTENQISAAGRALADRSAEACNVDKDDNWKIYGDDFIEDARAAIRALASQPAAPVQPEDELPVTMSTYGTKEACEAEHARRAAPPVQQPDDVREVEVLAWRTEDGRVVSSETMDGAKRDGGAMVSSLRAYNIPLVSALATTRPSAALTDERIEDIAHRKCTSYAHVPTDIGIKYKFAPHHMIDFARAILAASGGAEQVAEPKAYMRKWAFDGEKPYKVKNSNGRLTWANKFRILPITPLQCFPDDIPLVAAPATPSNKKEG